jgi:chromosome segregation ATPase
VQELEQKVQKLEEKSVELSRHENAITGTEAALCLRV